MTYSTQTKQYIVGLCFVILAAIMVMPSSASAETTSTTTATVTTTSTQLALIQSLMKQIEDLKAKLATLRGEVRSELKDGLKEGKYMIIPL